MKRRLPVILTFLALAGVYACGGSQGGVATPTPDTSAGEAPAFLTIDPSEIPVGGGSKITVTGSHLQGARVTVNGAAAADVVVTSGTPDTLTFTAPAGEAGAATIAVKNSDGLSAETSALVSYRDVDPCSADSSNGDQLFPKEWIEDGEGSLAYVAEADSLVFALGKKIYVRSGKEAWRLLTTLPDPVTFLLDAPGRPVVYAKISGEDDGKLVFGVWEIDLAAKTATTITPGIPSVSACQNAALSFDPVADALYLACEDRLWKKASGVWMTFAQNADIAGNLFVSVAAGTESGGTALVCAGAKTPPPASPSGEGVYCKEGNQAWALIPNTEWHQHFEFALRHLLLLKPDASGLISIVKHQDAQVLEGGPGQGWTELFHTASDALPADAALETESGRLFLIDDTCTLFRQDGGTLTDLGRLTNPLETFELTKCLSELTLDEAHAALYAPTYTNTCGALDGVCPRLLNIAGKCTSP